ACDRARRLRDDRRELERRGAGGALTPRRGGRLARVLGRGGGPGRPLGGAGGGHPEEADQEARQISKRPAGGPPGRGGEGESARRSASRRWTWPPPRNRWTWRSSPAARSSGRRWRWRQASAATRAEASARL